MILFTEPIVFAGLVGWYQAAMVLALVISIIEGPAWRWWAIGWQQGYLGWLPWGGRRFLMC